MPALVGDFDQQVAVGGVGDGDVEQVLQHDLHQGVLEPDAGAEQRNCLVTAVGNALGLGHVVPRLGAVEREQLGREVEGAVVDGQ